MSVSPSQNKEQKGMGLTDRSAMTTFSNTNVLSVFVRSSQSNCSGRNADERRFDKEGGETETCLVLVRHHGEDRLEDVAVEPSVISPLCFGGWKQAR